jgi:hypothetical protein
MPSFFISHTTTFRGHKKTSSVPINLPTKTPLTPPCLATSSPHVQLMSSNIHSSPLIPNKRKQNKNKKPINITASPSPFFLVSIVIIVVYTPNQKQEKVFILQTLQNFPSHIQTLKLKMCYICTFFPITSFAKRKSHGFNFTNMEILELFLNGLYKTHFTNSSLSKC